MNGNLMVLSCPTNHYASLYMKHHCVYRKLKSLAYFRKKYIYIWCLWLGLERFCASVNLQ